MTNTTAPAFTHTADCDSLTIGRLVQQLHAQALTEAPAPVDDALTVLEFVIRTANDGHDRACDCAKTALHKVETSLTTVRKRERALRNSPAFGSRDYSIVAHRLEELLEQRAALRAELAR
jgi:hypothetical protein